MAASQNPSPLSTQAPTPVFHSPMEELPPAIDSPASAKPKGESKRPPAISTSASVKDVAPSPSSASTARRSTVEPPSPTSSSRQSRPSQFRARSNSSKLLQRFTSRSSTVSNDAAGAPGTPGSEHSDLPSPGRIDREALERPRGKYKSGVKLDSDLFLPGQEPEAYMETSEPAWDESAVNPQEDEEVRQMLASGGTAAAKAYYSNLGYGRPVFPAQQRALMEASAKAALAAQANQAALPRRANPSRPSPPPSMTQVLQQQEQQQQQQQMRRSPLSVPLEEGITLTDGPVKPAARASPTETAANKHTAQKPSTGGGNSTGPSAWKGDSSKTSPADVSPEEESPSGDGKSPAPSIKSRRKTFLGFASKSTDRVDRVDKLGKKSRRASQVSVNEAGTNGAAEDLPRRRRYPNTRELDLVATELATEAAIEAQGAQAFGPHGHWGPTPVASGSRTPAERRLSSYDRSNGAPVINGLHGTLPSSGSLASMSNGFQAFTPPFAREQRQGSPNSSLPGSPRSLGLTDLPQGRPGLPKSPSNAPFSTVTQKAHVAGMPTDMLTGLGDGPYPMLPPRNDMFLDPFGSPDTSGYNSGQTTPRRSRVGSASATPGANGSSKRSVLSMTMHDPEAESQGLIKPTKSGRNTPWGSRAPSRTVTPKTSLQKLNEQAKQQQQSNNATFAGSRRRSQGEESALLAAVSAAAAIPTPVMEDPAPASQGAADAGSETDGTSAAVIAHSPKADDGATEPTRQARPPKPDTAATAETKKKSRRSIFGGFNKSSSNVVSSEAKDKKAAAKQAKSKTLEVPGAALPKSPSASSQISQASIPQSPASGRSSALLSTGSVALDSSSSISPRISPSSDSARAAPPLAAPASASTSGLSPLSNEVKTTESQADLTLTRTKSPARPPRSPQRNKDAATAPLPGQASQRNGSAQPRQTQSTQPPPSPQKSQTPSKADAASVRSAATGLSTPSKKDTPKRPGNFKRLLSKFGGKKGQNDVPPSPKADTAAFKAAAPKGAPSQKPSQATIVAGPAPLRAQGGPKSEKVQPAETVTPAKAADSRAPMLGAINGLGGGIKGVVTERGRRTSVASSSSNYSRSADVGLLTGDTARTDRDLSSDIRTSLSTGSASASSRSPSGAGTSGTSALAMTPDDYADVKYGPKDMKFGPSVTPAPAVPVTVAQQQVQVSR